jgi:hypothetical protein
VANKISVVIDVAVDKASASLKNFRSDLAKAEGASGKMKVGFSAASAGIKANAGAIAASAGAALVAFGVKSVQAFQDTALAAGKFADAAGIAVEDASRWMEVSGDLGIEAGAVQGAIMKMNKAAADGKPAFADFGVEIVRTKDGVVDASATFQNAITTIGAIEDPTLRAKAAQELFGKSYGSVAELMEMSAGDLQAALEGVSSAKVIDEQELRKAKEFRASMDTLKDRLEDVQLEVGGSLVPALTDMAIAIDEIATNANKLNDFVSELTGRGLSDWASNGVEVVDGFGRALDGSNNNAERAIGFFDGLVSIVPVVGQKIADLTPDIVYMSEAERLAAERADQLAAGVDGAGDAIDETTAFVKEINKAFEVSEVVIDDMNAAFDTLQGNLDDRAAWRNMKESLDELQETIADNESTWMDLGAATDEAVQKTAAYIMAADHIPTEKKTELITMLDEGALNMVLLIMDDLEKGVNVPVRFQGQDLVGFQKRAKGGPVRAGEPYIVGEEGPELVVPSQSGTVLTAGETRAALSPVSGSGMRSDKDTVSGSAITVNIYPKALPTDRELIDLVNSVRRRNGNVI